MTETIRRIWSIYPVVTESRRQPWSQPSEIVGIDFEADRTVSVGVIGAGFVAQEYHLPVLSELSETEITYVADIDPEAARDATSPFGSRALGIDDPATLPECDVALLTVPVGYREPYIQEFGTRGTPILSEKPFAPMLKHMISLPTWPTVSPVRTTARVLTPFGNSGHSSMRTPSGLLTQSRSSRAGSHGRSGVAARRRISRQAVAASS